MDWEAILAQHPDQFIAALRKWMVPPAALPSTNSTAADGAVATPADSAKGDSGPFKDVGELPGVNGVLVTIRRRLEALNGPSAPPVV